MRVSEKARPILGRVETSFAIVDHPLPVTRLGGRLISTFDAPAAANSAIRAATWSGVPSAR